MNNLDKILQPNELARYSRHLSLPTIGHIGQQKLKNARVLCIGAGGLGSALLSYLAAAGVGIIGIVEDDKIELSNLQRQILYATEDVGSKKVAVAKKKLQALNPNIVINIYDERLTKNNAIDIISQYDIIADGSDNFTTRYLVNDCCFQLKKPNVNASVLQFEGQCSIFTADDGPCYRCLYSNPSSAPSCSDAGVLNILPGIMGTIQAAEVIKLILKQGEPLIGRLLTFNALTMRFIEFTFTKNPDCQLCANEQTFDEITLSYNQNCYSQSNAPENLEISATELFEFQKSANDFLLLDVREPYEHAFSNIGGKLIPLPQLPYRLNELDINQQIIVYCRVGERSRIALAILQDAGFTSIKHLTGGIISWAKEIDPTVLQY